VPIVSDAALSNNRSDIHTLCGKNVEKLWAICAQLKKSKEYLCGLCFQSYPQQVENYRKIISRFGYPLFRAAKKLSPQG
jgi:hypothetical protein